MACRAKLQTLVGDLQGGVECTKSTLISSPPQKPPFQSSLHHPYNMAELLAVAASGISVVSFAIQIAESIQKLKYFYSLVQSAPTDILLLIDEIETLSLILEDIDRSVQNSVFLDPHTKGVVMRSYTLCQKSGVSLKTLVQELEQGLKAGKKKGALKVALKNDKIEEFRKRLESAKMTMSLANQLYDRAMQQQRWDSQERGIDHLTAQFGLMLSMQATLEKTEPGNAAPGSVITKSEVADERVQITTSCLTQQSKLGRSKLKNQTHTTRMSGMLEIRRADRGNSTETSISLRLPSWLYARRYDIFFRRACQGWDQSFRSYRVIPYESLVFEYSMAGDVAGLQRLFSTGQSSPFQVDPDGRTPLHVKPPPLCMETGLSGIACSNVLQTTSLPLSTRSGCRCKCSQFQFCKPVFQVR